MYVIQTESCIACNACVPACPVDAITVEDGNYVVGDECIDCGACADVCPAAAVFQE